jgi:hypothetical protein
MMSIGSGEEVLNTMGSGGSSFVAGVSSSMVIASARL